MYSSHYVYIDVSVCGGILAYYQIMYIMLSMCNRVLYNIHIVLITLIYIYTCIPHPLGSFVYTMLPWGCENSEVTPFLIGLPFGLTPLPLPVSPGAASPSRVLNNCNSEGVWLAVGPLSNELYL